MAKEAVSSLLLSYKEILLFAKKKKKKTWHENTESLGINKEEAVLEADFLLSAILGIANSYWLAWVNLRTLIIMRREAEREDQ